MQCMDDKLGPALALRLQAHDAAAFNELVQSCERPLFNLAFRMLGNADEAADATQDVFVKVFENVATYDPQRRLFSWIYRIAVNESLDRLKHHRRTDAVAVPVEDLPLASNERGPAEQAQGGEAHDLIQAALMELPRDYRAVIVLRHFSDLSYAQMAETLHIPEKTVKSRLYSARQELRAKLCTRGLTA